MPKFEDKFVRFRWSDELKGKQCFVADNMFELREVFERGERRTVTGEYSEADPFIAENAFPFCYYDPNYDNKVAYEQGKQIQFKNHNEWLDVVGEPTWDLGNVYRFKPAEVGAYVILNKTDPNKPVLLWNFDKDIEEETRHIYFRGTPEDCRVYICTHSQFVSAMLAWEAGEQIQFKNHNEWLDVVGEPTWDLGNVYRFKPEGPAIKWTDLKIGDIIKTVDGNCIAMVTGIDYNDSTGRPVYAGKWLSDKELKDWRKVNG